MELPEYFTLWLLQYGSFALFFLLALGIIALPVPEETLMVVTGALVHQGYLPMVPTFIAAYLGSICGITVSYILGLMLEKVVVEKYGSYVGLTEAKMKRAHEWFERFGKWMLFIGYFIPGVRHFTGFFAGTTYMKYSHFALYAYAGAIFWATTFLTFGYFFGSCCEGLYQPSTEIQAVR